jgi:Ala-tRNA(Pro) deacylase
MILKKLIEFLDDNHVRYVNLTHSAAFTAQDVAQSAHISGKEMAKTVIVWMDGAMGMVVLPASSMIDFNKLKELSGAKNIELASETEFKDRFSECEVGAMPPFGIMFNIRVFVDKTLSEDQEIAFNAGSHKELIRMRYADYEALVKPVIGSFAIQKK